MNVYKNKKNVEVKNLFMGLVFFYLSNIGDENLNRICNEL